MKQKKNRNYLRISPSEVYLCGGEDNYSEYGLDIENIIKQISALGIDYLTLYIQEYVTGYEMYDNGINNPYSKCCANCEWCITEYDEEEILNSHMYEENDPNRPVSGNCSLGNIPNSNYYCDEHSLIHEEAYFEETKELILSLYKKKPNLFL